MGIAALRDLWRSLRALASFARVLRSDDSGPLQTFQIEGFIGEIRDDVPRIGEWGLASRPPADAQAVVLSLGGDRGRMVAIGVEDRETRRKNLAEGETFLYGAANADTRIGIDQTGAALVSGVSSRVESTNGTVTIQSVGAPLSLFQFDGENLNIVTANTGGTGGDIVIGAFNGATVQLQGTSIEITAPSVLVNGVEFVGHTHTIPPGTDSGGGVTGVPQ